MLNYNSEMLVQSSCFVMVLRTIYTYEFNYYFAKLIYEIVTNALLYIQIEYIVSGIIIDYKRSLKINYI